VCIDRPLNHERDIITDAEVAELVDDVAAERNRMTIHLNDDVVWHQNTVCRRIWNRLDDESPGADECDLVAEFRERDERCILFRLLHEVEALTPQILLGHPHWADYLALPNRHTIIEPSSGVLEDIGLFERNRQEEQLSLVRDEAVLNFDEIGGVIYGSGTQRVVRNRDRPRDRDADTDDDQERRENPWPLRIGLRWLHRGRHIGKGWGVFAYPEVLIHGARLTPRATTDNRCQISGSEPKRAFWHPDSGICERSELRNLPAGHKICVHDYSISVRALGVTGEHRHRR